MLVELRQVVQEVSRRPEAVAAVAALYGRVRVEIDHRPSNCRSCGQCCDFDRFGHRLYVTALELAVFVHNLKLAGVAGTTDALGCPFQVSNLCSVHGFRPFGCRIFFCDPAASPWQSGAYERFHAEIKALHDELGVGYWYVEWREGLRAVIGG